MILCIGTTPAAQRVMIFPRIIVDEVNRATTTLDGAAGKSVNVAKVLKTLGEHPLTIGFLGKSLGDQLRQDLLRRGIQDELLPVPAPARQCITLIDQDAGTVTELVEESRSVPPEFYVQLTERIRSLLPGAKAVIMSGSLTPGAPVDFYRRCTDMAHVAGALPVVDAQGAPLAEALKARPALVKPNRRELAATLGRELTDQASVCAGLREMHEGGAGRVVVTAGAEPVLAFDGSKIWKVFSPVIQPLNPIGSGDAFTAALIWRLLKGEELGEACRWGAAAGAANALSPMPGDLQRKDVERLYTQSRAEQVPA